MQVRSGFQFSLILGSAAAALASGAGAWAVPVASPSVLNSSTPFNASFPASNAFNGIETEYASQGQGANTFIEMNFGSAVTFDRVIVINRNSTAPGDRVSQSLFTFSTDTVFGGGDPTATIAHNSGQGTGSISHFAAPVTTQYARWDVDLLAPGTPVALNTGVMEMIFLNTPVGGITVPNVVAYNAAAAFNANFVAANAVNGIAGRSAGGIEYASAGQGANTFIDFDMGATRGLLGFDVIDRIAGVDKTNAFNLIFSDDPTFSTVVATLNYSKGSALAFGDTFAGPISARYVRYDVVSAAAGGTNLGMSEIIFYQVVPEPSSALLLGVAAIGAMLRRRRA